MKACVTCGAELTGRQTKNCSPLCASRSFNAARIADGRLKAQRIQLADSRNAYYEAGKVERTCPCGSTFKTTRHLDSQYCSGTCSQQFRYGYCRLPSGHPVKRVDSVIDMRSVLRRAIEDVDPVALKAALLDRSDADGECWIWRGATSDGYPQINGGRKRRLALHRAIASVVHGPLGSQPVHHKCANTRCVNPDHLQPISHRENIAEMLQRNYYLTRIAELEDALAQHEPAHSLLLEAGVPRAS